MCAIPSNSLELASHDCLSIVLRGRDFGRGPNGSTDRLPQAVKQHDTKVALHHGLISPNPMVQNLVTPADWAEQQLKSNMTYESAHRQPSVS